MSDKKPISAVKVTLLGEELVIRSETSPDQTRKIVEYVDSTIKEILKSGAAIETPKAVLLASLRIAGELFELRASAEKTEADIKNMSDEIRRWLPPAKRGD